MTEDLNPRFSFDSYVVGAGNRLAVTAARTVAESPGTAYNPLFIYSASGLGKTHLLMAIGQLAKQLGASVQVEYVTLDEFVEAYHAAVAAGHSEALRNRFTGVDVLLVDDVQFLTNRREMQAELIRITSQLQTAGKQIVLSSDCPPSDIEDLDERLLARFGGGLVVDIGAPDYETRLAILRRRGEERGAQFQPGVLEAVADFEVLNVRELLGLLNRLVAYQAVSESALTPQAATELLAGEVPAKGEGAAAEVAEPVPELMADEFADFLSDVSHTVAEQVEVWRSRLGDAILRWQAEGYRTIRLEELLQQEVPASAEHAVREYERDIERLRSSQITMAKLDAERAEDPVFYDPDRLDEADAMVQAALQEIGPPPGPSAAWSFDSFIGGESNRLALNAARTAAEHPGARYNPFVLVGPTGVGKTHLLHAIGHHLASQPDVIVACLSAQQFLDELVQAIDANKVDLWRSRYRRASALLLDDVQLLAGKERSQEELFHLFNTLLDAQCQLGFTLTVQPSETEGLEERLISRLEGGLVAALKGPDRDLRRAIVVRKLQEQSGHADDELADYLAARPAESIRAVLGTVQRVFSAAEAQGVAPSAAIARDVIEGVVPARPRPSGGVRTSGVMVSPTGGIRSREKTVWAWPDPVERIVEELV